MESVNEVIVYCFVFVPRRPPVVAYLVQTPTAGVVHGDDAALGQSAISMGAGLVDTMPGVGGRSRGEGDTKKQSAGRRLGKMLRRSTPSLTHLRSYRY